MNSIKLVHSKLLLLLNVLETSNDTVHSDGSDSV